MPENEIWKFYTVTRDHTSAEPLDTGFKIMNKQIIIDIQLYLNVYLSVDASDDLFSLEMSDHSRQVVSSIHLYIHFLHIINSTHSTLFFSCISNWYKKIHWIYSLLTFGYSLLKQPNK